MKYRKKPVVIEAVQYLNNSERDNWEEIHNFVGGVRRGNDSRPFIEIETLEGVMRAYPNDWIIKGVKGEFYPCKPDIFEATYERVE